MELFQNRKLLIATRHHKEKVIAPIVEKALGVYCFVDAGFDTDVFGTFTGEVDRALDPLATVREKCLRAMRFNNCDLGIASEGSFGPHPSLFFVNADDELLIFIDTKHNIEVVVRELSTATNFNGRTIHDQEELLAFAEQVQFPSHALILRKAKEENVAIHKGITDTATLLKVFEDLYNQYGLVYAETDMRAMYNPTRMQVIAQAAEKLLQKIQSLCPHCQMPGFGITDVQQGLPCSWCGFPTRSTLSYLYVCSHCRFTQEERYPHHKTEEDPMYCDRCNP
ncbi:MAG: hypothetical protein KGO81_10875 [Bacteroidota bacterium]|nr:hypothetical protein [Bacteroidota bacterium]